MENLCNKNILIEYSNVDTRLSLSVFHATNIVQNIMTDLFENIGVTNMILKKRHNAAWVISKLQIHFMDYPKLNDMLNATAFVSSNSKIRLNLDGVFKNPLGNTMFYSRQEICPMDLKTRKVRRLDTINYPNDLDLKQSNYTMRFSRFNFNLTDFVQAYTYTVAYCDIDFTRHVNNASYVRFMLNALDANFFNNNIITDLEIHYINECCEGDILNIYKQIVNNKINFIILHNETKIIEASFSFTGAKIS